MRVTLALLLLAVVLAVASPPVSAYVPDTGPPADDCYLCWTFMLHCRLCAISLLWDYGVCFPGYSICY